MCFFKHSSKPKVKVAGRDVICYKILRRDADGELLSPYRGVKYEIGKVKKIGNNFKTKPYDFNTGNRYKNSIDIGLHSLSTLAEAENWKWQIGRSNSEIFECVIPKGAKYWYNPFDHEYCSNQLLVKSQIK